MLVSTFLTCCSGLDGAYSGAGGIHLTNTCWTVPNGAGGECPDIHDIIWTERWAHNVERNVLLDKTRTLCCCCVEVVVEFQCNCVILSMQVMVGGNNGSVLRYYCDALSWGAPKIWRSLTTTVFMWFSQFWTHLAKFMRFKLTRWFSQFWTHLIQFMRFKVVPAAQIDPVSFFNRNSIKFCYKWLS